MRKARIGTYIHEFIHTIELDLDLYSFHETLGYYLDFGLSNVIEDYLLNEAFVDGDRVGIPYDYWIGNCDVHVGYHSNVIDGWSTGKIIRVGEIDDTPFWQTVALSAKIPYGSDISVEARPLPGYRFVKWSDGVTSAIRNDTNITTYLSITAIFEKIE